MYVGLSYFKYTYSYSLFFADVIKPLNKTIPRAQIMFEKDASSGKIFTIWNKDKFVEN